MWSARFMMEAPDLVEAVHRDYIDAGARVITLNNYAATPERLARDARAELFQPLQQQAMDIARRARDNSRRGQENNVRIAGCLPPLFASYKPELAPGFDECLGRYKVIADIQAPGVDLFICETMASIKEGRASAMAALDTGRPVWLSFTLDDSAHGKLRSGENLQDAVAAVSDLDIGALLLNCSIPEAIDAAMPQLCGAFNPAGAYANGFTSVAALQAGGTVEVLSVRKDLDPDAYAAFGLGWVRAGARIVGGCCEVGPTHIAELERQLTDAGYVLTSDL